MLTNGRNAMKVAAILGIVLLSAVACGESKPPLVPDGPEMNMPDAGDLPPTSASAAPSAAPAPSK
jgi:hypothetical protein